MADVRLNIKVLGTQKIKERLRRMEGLIPNAVAQGIYLEGNNVMTESKEMSPVEWGTLKNSGYVTLPEMHGGRLVSELGYGGPAAEYAVVQHEHIEYRHPEGGEAKFLEKPFYQRAPSIPSNIARLARRAIERGQGSQPAKAPGMPATPTGGPFPPETKRSKRKK